MVDQEAVKAPPRAPFGGIRARFDHEGGGKVTPDPGRSPGSEVVPSTYICPIGSRRPPEVLVTEPTDAWHLHHPALTGRVHTPQLGRVLGQR